MNEDSKAIPFTVWPHLQPTANLLVYISILMPAISYRARKSSLICLASLRGEGGGGGGRKHWRDLDALPAQLLVTTLVGRSRENKFSSQPTA